jgi:two-component system, cell cycle sensor histidine kinase and response regulator CckA
VAVSHGGTTQLAEPNFSSVVVDVGGPSGCLRALSDSRLARVIAVPTLADLPPELGRVDLVVTTETAVVRTARAAYATSPILALVRDEAAAPDAVEAGADYVLPVDASAGLVIAVYLAAVRGNDRRPRTTTDVERERQLARSKEQLLEAQTQLIHSSRLAALGQMAAGVAHEINNPLQYVLSGIEELGETDALEADRRQILADMLAGAQRIRSVTRSLLPFARGATEQVERVDINEIVTWAAGIGGSEIRARARLELRLGLVPTVVGQRARLGQLVSHLLSNAADAISEGASEKHRIIVSTEEVAGRVRLVVEDTGRGIPDDIRPRIFDPFFTTKPRQVGTGLGLALCAEIVTRQGGTIAFESTVDVGSRFVVVFGENEGARTPVPLFAPQSTARKPRVLVVDDEELVVRAYGRFLKDHDVVTAIGGKAALEVLSRDRDFDAILCDLMMPGVDGPMIYAHISEAAPQLVPRVLFCSGGAFTLRARAFLDSIPNVVLDKPITPKQLRAALAKLIARHR